MTNKDYLLRNIDYHIRVTDAEIDELANNYELAKLNEAQISDILGTIFTRFRYSKELKAAIDKIIVDTLNEELEISHCKCKHEKKSHRYSELFSNNDNEAVYMECSICKCAEFEESKK